MVNQVKINSNQEINTVPIVTASTNASINGRRVMMGFALTGAIVSVVGIAHAAGLLSSEVEKIQEDGKEDWRQDMLLQSSYKSLSDRSLLEAFSSWYISSFDAFASYLLKEYNFESLIRASLAANKVFDLGPYNYFKLHLTPHNVYFFNRATGLFVMRQSFLPQLYVNLQQGRIYRE